MPRQPKKVDDKKVAVAPAPMISVPASAPVPAPPAAVLPQTTLPLPVQQRVIDNESFLRVRDSVSLACVHVFSFVPCYNVPLCPACRSQARLLAEHARLKPSPCRVQVACPWCCCCTIATRCAFVHDASLSAFLHSREHQDRPRRSILFSQTTCTRLLSFVTSQWDIDAVQQQAGRTTPPLLPSLFTLHGLPAPLTGPVRL